jgi:uncharacterized membrane protein YraQ (UPF0718 family)
METALAYIGNLFTGMVWAVLNSLAHNAWVLAISIVTAVALKTYVDSSKLTKFLMRRTRVSILLSVAVGAFTPFCACGTMAVIVGMLTTTLPWGPIMAFLTSSPLMSPDGFLMISGMIGFRFAAALTAASLVIGVASGFATQWIERNTHFLRGQARYLDKGQQSSCGCSGGVAAEAAPTCGCGAKPAEAAPACGCGVKPAEAAPACGCGVKPVKTAPSACGCGAPAQSCAMDDCGRSPEMEPAVQRASAGVCCAAMPLSGGAGLAGWMEKARLRELLDGFIELGLKQILLYFSLFIGVGYLINAFVPASIVSSLLGANSFAAVPLASLIGLPLYLTTESSIPIIQSLIRSGASEGAMLAFIISGSATSAWVIAGLTTFMKKRALLLYVSYILLGSVLAGYLYDAFLKLA